MARFVALAWDSNSPGTEESAKFIRHRLQTVRSQWPALMGKPGLYVCAPAKAPHGEKYMALAGGMGVAIGALHSFSETPTQNANTDLAAFSAAEVDELVRTKGKSICGRRWGNYVLIISGQHGGCVHVFRGPMSSIPCFFIGFKGVRVFFSDVEDCIALQLIAFSLNWGTVRAQAAKGDYVTQKTGIVEIQSLVPGECMEVTRGESQSLTYWSPWSVTPVDADIEFAEATKLFDAAIRLSVNTAIMPHETVIHQLSGGFDSSLVLACMKQAPSSPEIICVTFYSRKSGDERKYARCMAQSVGCELIEAERDLNVDLSIFLRCARTATPVLHFSACDIEARLIALAKASGATTITSGELGDNIFMRHLGPEAIAECFAQCGLRAKLWETTVNYARLNGLTVWSALAQGVRFWKHWSNKSQWSMHEYWKHRGYTVDNGARLLTDAALAEYEQALPNFSHPWLRNIRGKPLGYIQLLHGLQMVTSPWTQSPFAGSDAGLFSTPLATQPLVEACMRIPTHFHLRGARSGAVARGAFGPILPQTINHRGLGKGTPELWIRDLVAKNRVFLQEILLDGLLVKNGILDRAKLTSVLSADVTASKVLVSEVFQQLYIEAWSRRWEDLAKEARSNRNTLE